MNTHEFNVSVIDPVSPAIERARVMLFKPFDMRKWFVIGFCAWLACLGSGGGGFNFPNWYPQQHGRGGGPDQAINQVKDYISYNLGWIIPVAVFVVLLLIVLGIVFVWLSSRGRFMFLHCVAENKAEVKVPWTKFKQHGNSLFLFRIVLGLIALAVMVIPVVFAIFAAIALARTKAHAGLVLVLVGVFFVFLVISICFALVHKFTTDFVVPIMFLRSTSCRVAWREFLTLLSTNKVRFILYILFQILIAMAIGVIGASVACLFACLLVCFTCGIAGCLMILPPLSIGYGYITTVLLLPLSVFKRAYSLHYIRQFGPEFDVFSPEIEPA